MCLRRRRRCRQTQSSPGSACIPGFAKMGLWMKTSPGDVLVLGETEAATQSTSLKAAQRRSVGLRIVNQMCPAVLSLLASLDQGDLDHPVTVVQLTKRLSDLIFWAEQPEALDLADWQG